MNKIQNTEHGTAPARGALTYLQLNSTERVVASVCVCTKGEAIIPLCKVPSSTRHIIPRPVCLYRNTYEAREQNNPASIPGPPRKNIPPEGRTSRIYALSCALQPRAGEAGAANVLALQQCLHPSPTLNGSHHGPISSHSQHPSAAVRSACLRFPFGAHTHDDPFATLRPGEGDTLYSAVLTLTS